MLPTSQTLASNSVEHLDGVVLVTNDDGTTETIPSELFVASLVAPAPVLAPVVEATDWCDSIAATFLPVPMMSACPNGGIMDWHCFYKKLKDLLDEINETIADACEMQEEAEGDLEDAQDALDAAELLHEQVTDVCYEQENACLYACWPDNRPTCIQPCEATLASCTESADEDLADAQQTYDEAEALYNDQIEVIGLVIDNIIDGQVSDFETDVLNCCSYPGGSPEDGI